MMQAIKSSRLKDRWYVVGQVAGGQDTAWAFDRFRLYYPTIRTQVGIKYNLTQWDSTDGRYMLVSGDEPELIQPFNNDYSYDHEFTFDLSADTGNCWFCIKGIPSSAEFQQIYTYPTGFSQTRNKDANIVTWDFSVINTGINVGGADTSIRFENQPMIGITWRNNNTTATLYAKTIRFDGCQLSSSSLDNALIWTDRSGVQNGTINISNNPNTRTTASDAAKSSLQSKGWTVTE